mgnify:CR=1 FL=1
MSRSRRAVRWLQPGLVVKRWVLTSGFGLLLALLGAAVWADLQPIYWMLSTIKWLLQEVTQVLPRGVTGPLVLVAGAALGSAVAWAIWNLSLLRDAQRGGGR